MRLDRRDDAINSGVIVPGDPDDSEMIRRVESPHEDEIMPPPASHKVLTPEQRATLRRWVAEGAEYEPHWSFITPTRPESPEVANSDWVQNPIDAFILQRLEAEGLAPAPQADRRTLARRVSLDLTGLPPSPEMVEAFVNDQSPDAYEKLVDQLLESPAWGEHRARYWLDAARYADTHGMHFDNFREMWSYREWVIDAFNRNLPFDQFTIEQLAGDLLPDATLDQQIASGFHRCNITTNEGGIIDEEYLVLYARDRTETTALVWMGLTAGCAVCHDHKFDPLSQREFYELAAFFNNTTQGARDGNIKDSPPIIPVPLETDRERYLALETEIPATEAAVNARRESARGEFDSWLAGASADSVATPVSDDALTLRALCTEGEGQSLNITVEGQPRTITLESGIGWGPGYSMPQALVIQDGGTVELADAGDFDTEERFSYGAWVKLPENAGAGPIFARMDDQNDYRGWDLWIQENRVGTHIINQWSQNAIKVVSKNPIPVGEWTHVFVTYDGSATIEGVGVYVNGVRQEVTVEANTLQAGSTIRTEVPLKFGQRHTTPRLNGLGIEDVRIYRRQLSSDEVLNLATTSRIAAYLAKSPEDRTEAETNELYQHWLTSIDPVYQQLSASLAALKQEQTEITQRGTIAHVMNERDEPAMAYVLYRGEYDERRDPVTADTPAILPEFPDDLPHNRLGLAKWIVSSEHPLTARVTVNRYWQEVFGMGLVQTAGDFGITGELPTHPELLDWLAVEFRESGWDVKAFFKLLVMSEAYQQSAITTPEKLAADPQNRLLSRGPRFRMDAEMVRDYALAASGLLVEEIGGPSVKPYQPPGVWESIAMNVSNTRSYEPDSGEGLYRRSLYTFWKRMAPPASMEILNAPNREYCVVQRERTNTPLQALVTLNDEQFIEAARQLAQNSLLEAGNSDVERVDYLTLRLLSRTFRDEERTVVQRSLDSLREFYLSHPEEADALVNYGESDPAQSMETADLAVWTMLTNQILNLDEVLCK